MGCKVAAAARPAARAWLSFVGAPMKCRGRRVQGGRSSGACRARVKLKAQLLPCLRGALPGLHQAKQSACGLDVRARPVGAGAGGVQGGVQGEEGYKSGPSGVGDSFRTWNVAVARALRRRVRRNPGL